jgi:hypothetical protein
MTRIFQSMSAVLVLVLAGTACQSDSGVAPGSALSLGQSKQLSGPQSVTLDGTSAGADYYAVLVNTSQTAGATENYSLTGSGIVAPATSLGSLGGATLDRTFTDATAADLAPERDRAFEARLRASERRLVSRFAGARSWRAARAARTSATVGASGSRTFDVTRRDGALPANVQVGDIVTVNVNGDDACANPIYHGARVTAIGTHGIVLNDTLNPSGGFTTADFQRYAARFDTLVYPIDSAAFGPPTDIDGNGHVGLIFTRAVNELTPANASSYVGGFTFSRDLFPATATANLDACAASNQGEFFYLLTPDPTGTINGNTRTTGFVDTNTTAIIAHEFQHLINGGRRIYVNNASDFEETWLDEGLAHIAEELLFYREAGLGPKGNLDTPQLRASTQRRTAFNVDMLGNAGRYRSYLLAPSKSSPYAADDSLSTRGGAWSLLRYLADRSGRSDNAFFFALVNSTTRGIANLSTVYGSDLAGAVRDWNASNAVDDLVTTSTELLQPSWNWHSIYPVLYGSYPLSVKALTDGAASTGSIVAGGAAYYRIGVPAGGSATLSITDPSSTAATNLQLVVVRTR